ncbi:MAG: polysulfide reductase NrfD [Chloroflexi bacterium]|nr:polysulfide reductase NrfD [Chloroflexota bacterium]
MGFLYPNEAAIEWDLLIVIYPYITGLVAGAFIVSSLYHVFGITTFNPIARFSLITALAFLLVAPIPLAIHLGRPERALEMFLRPNFTSAMSGFGFIWMVYLLLVLFEIWLVFRPDIVRYAKSGTGIRKTIYSILALGVYDVSERALAVDHKLIKIFAFIGIPAASLLHGYVGFIFGAIKANPWWSTPLMPIIFLLSAVVSGIALLLVMYVLSTKIRKVPLDHVCLRTLALWLGGFLTVALTLEGLEAISMFYESEESWEVIRELITGKIALSYFGIQFFAGAFIPMVTLAITETAKLDEHAKTVLRFFAACLILVGVFAMRWNVVIGGQLVSKSLRGIGDFTPPLMGISGILVSAAVLLLPLVILGVIVYLIPPWQDGVKPVQQKRLGISMSGLK